MSRAPRYPWNAEKRHVIHLSFSPAEFALDKPDAAIVFNHIFGAKFDGKRLWDEWHNRALSGRPLMWKTVIDKPSGNYTPEENANRLKARQDITKAMRTLGITSNASSTYSTIPPPASSADDVSPTTSPPTQPASIATDHTTTRDASEQVAASPEALQEEINRLHGERRLARVEYANREEIIINQYRRLVEFECLANRLMRDLRAAQGLIERGIAPQTTGQANQAQERAYVSQVLLNAQRCEDRVRELEGELARTDGIIAEQGEVLERLTRGG